MSPAVEKILREALELSEDARVDLAAAILDSVDHEPADPGAEEDWRQEAKRRLEEIRSGAVKPVPWDEARTTIFGASDGAKGR
jgi:putative addiction module component (TIGR02574 family)